MSKLTTEQKKAYIANPNKCPFCTSPNITMLPLESDSKEAWAYVTCSTCEEQWTEVYTLTDIETDES